MIRRGQPVIGVQSMALQVSERRANDARVKFRYLGDARYHG